MKRSRVSESESGSVLAILGKRRVDHVGEKLDEENVRTGHRRRGRCPCSTGDD